MDVILALLIVPVAFTVWTVNKYPHRYTWKEGILSVVITFVIVSGVYFAGKYSNTQDFEILNGEVISKKREHGSYVRSYSCNCTTRCSGSGKTQSCSTVCQTCYENRYTVDWYANTTLGKITFKSLDTASRSVYNSPDPTSFIKCKPGEPASKEHWYVNYVKATPDSLFNTGMVSNYEIPSYPEVYDFYRYNRVINVNSKIKQEDILKLNNKISDSLKTLGALRQVNVIVVLTEIDDTSYRHAIENAWIGGKKNDVVVFLGMDEYNYTWVDVMTWALNSGNELFRVKLKDEIFSHKQFDIDKISGSIEQQIKAHYDRPKMEDFEYLKDEINPPTWVIVLALILSVGSTIGLAVFFYENEVI